jgi:type VI secretion system protein ImpF
VAENITRERLQPSLLDRLTDQAPEHTRETFEQQTLGLMQLRQAVLRDLAWLLNTTNLAATEDLGATPLAAKSTINFGVPGLAGNIGTAERLGAIETGIADAIRAFEPRIRPETLKVRLRPSSEDKPTPALVFEIRGELWAQPVPQQLFLETAIELETRMAVITDVRGGTR